MSDELVEGIDYTIDPETGFLVFTSAYLLKRGYCCKNACRNCPYGYMPDVDDAATENAGDKGPVSR